MWILFILFLFLIYSIQETNGDPTKSLRLKYFDARGAAELSRIMLRVHHIPFEDVRYPVKPVGNGEYSTEQFQEEKKVGSFSANMGRLPILEINEISIGQSQAIERYIASICDLMGSTKEESAIIDCIVNNVQNIKDEWAHISKIGGFAPNAHKNGLRQKWVCEGEFSSWLQKLENSLPVSLGQNNSQSFSVGHKLSFADFSIWHLLRDYFPSDFMQAVRLIEKKGVCVRLSRIADEVSALPELKKYIASRNGCAF